MTDQTPSPQSVVVPVEPTEAMMKAADAVDWSNEDERASAINMWQSMLAAAPAPSSLAGGEVDVEFAPNFGFETNEPSLRQVIEFYYRSHGMENWPKLAAQYCAALSPEAPVREGVSGADMLTMTCFANNHDNPEAWTAWSRIRSALTPRHEAPARDGVALDKRIADAAERDRRERDKAFRGESYEPLTPTHEAPACDDCGSPLNSDGECTRDLAEREADDRHEAPAEGAGEVCGLCNGDCSAANPPVLDCPLRARSSAPEAREEALGNLLAVIHGDGGHRALEVGTKQAALEAEKIVAGLFAAPSADKRRIAVEAMQGAIEWDKRTGYRMPYRVRDPLYAALDLTTPDALKGDAK